MFLTGFFPCRSIVYWLISKLINVLKKFNNEITNPVVLFYSDRVKSRKFWCIEVVRVFMAILHAVQTSAMHVRWGLSSNKNVLKTWDFWCNFIVFIFILLDYLRALGSAFSCICYNFLSVLQGRTLEQKTVNRKIAGLFRTSKFANVMEKF